MVSASTFQNRQMIRAPISSIEVIGKMNFFQRYSFLGKSLNVSYDGICFKTSSNCLEVGQKIKLGTCFYDGDYLFKATGNVRWMNINDDPPGSMNIGVKLIKTSYYNIWCRKVDAALSLNRLHDIQPISCNADAVLPSQAWETVYGPVEFKGKGFGKKNYIKTVKFGNNCLSGDKVIIKGESFEVFKSRGWVKYKGNAEIIPKSNVTSGYIGVKTDKGQVITVEVKRLGDLQSI